MRNFGGVMVKSILAVMLAALVALGGAGAALYIYNRPTVLRVAAPQSAEDMRLITAAGHVFADQHESIRLRLTPVADAVASAAALESGAVDLAVLRGDVLMPPSAQALVILHRNAALLVAPGGSKLRKVSDLRGKRIGVTRDSAGVDANSRLLETILTQYDVPLKSVTLTPLAAAEVRQAIEAGRVDAVFAAGAPQRSLTNDVVGAVAEATGKPPVFLPITEAKAIAKRAPALEPTEILQGAFGGDPPRPAASTDSVSVSVVLAARNSLKDTLAGEVTRLFFTHRAAIALMAPLANSIEAPSTDKGAALPVHQGAADYLDGNEHSFFDKYSDFIYIGAMLLSLVGSAAAAIASRLNFGAQQHTERMVERLLEILKIARTIESPAELDALEQETHDLLLAALADRKLRSGEPHSLHLVTLALDQARRAIMERRRQLKTGGAVVAFAPPRGRTAE